MTSGILSNAKEYVEHLKQEDNVYVIESEAESLLFDTTMALEECDGLIKDIINKAKFVDGSFVGSAEESRIYYSAMNILMKL